MSKKLLSMKNSYIRCLVLLIAFFFVRVGKNTFANATYSNNSEWIVASVTNGSGKSNLWLIDTKTKEKQNVVKNRDVLISGTINKEGDVLLYSDALGKDSWNIFKLNIPSQETFQVTKDSLGEFNLHFGDEKGNIIYAKSGNKNSPIPRIKKIDLIKKTGKFLDIGADLWVEDFDIKNNKIIVLAFSFPDFVTKKLKASNLSAKIPYSIVEMDIDGDNRKIINKFEAVRIDSIAFTNEENTVIIGGEGIKEGEKGFYKLDIEKIELKTLLTEKQLQETKKDFKLSHPLIANISSDGQKIYFTAIPSGTTEKEISGITVYPNNIYSYSLENKELEEVFKGNGDFISSILITYK